MLCLFMAGATFTIMDELNLIPAFISYDIHYKMWDEITHPFHPLKFGYVISSHTLLGMWLLIPDEIEINPC